MSRAASPRSRRRGSVYLLVLATSSLVAIVGISGLMAARLGRAQSVLRVDASAAETLARAGLVSLGNRIGRDPAYAEASAAVGWSEAVLLGEGSYRTRVLPATAPGLYPVRVRAAVGDSVRVLGATLREPARLGPEVLAGGSFDSGLFPTKRRGGEGTLVVLQRDGAAVFAGVSGTGSSRIGIEQPVTHEPGVPYRLAARIRTPSGSAAVTLGLERRTLLLSTINLLDVWVGPQWQEVEMEDSFPASPLGGASWVYLDIVGDRGALHVERISLRRVLPPRPADLVLGSLRPLADDPVLATGGTTE